MRGTSLLYGGLSFSFMRSSSRLGLRETASRLVEENQLAPLVDSAGRYARSGFLFWFMALFAFNPANLKRFRPWMMAVIALEVVLLVPVVAWMSTVTGSLFMIPFAAIFALFVPMFLSMEPGFTIVQPLCVRSKWL